MGQPAFFIKELIADNNVYVFSSNYALYGDMSQRVMDTLVQFTPTIEIYSIDEAFLSFKGLEYYDLQAHGQTIRETVKRNTGIPVCVGIAPTKTLAKIANRLAKKRMENKGVFVISTASEIEDALTSTNISDVWGIGSQYAEFLNRHGINTALDYAKAPEAWVKKYLSVVGLRTRNELSGIPCIAFEDQVEDKKNIATTRSFGDIQTEIGPISEAVATFAGACAEKLRKQHTCASTLTVFIHTNQFRTQDKQYARNRVMQFPVATNSSLELIKYAQIGLKSIFKKGYKYKKAGVIVSGLVPDSQVSGTLFDEVNRSAHKRLMTALDEINTTFGREKVRVASQGFDRSWKLRQERLSPNYTTKWNEILTINV